jgi:hypothetical protein
MDSLIVDGVIVEFEAAFNQPSGIAQRNANVEI